MDLVEETLPSAREKPKPTDSIKVLIRIRPLSDSEKASFGPESAVDIITPNTVNLRSQDGKKNFQCAYDQVLGVSSTQEDLYRVVQNGTQSVLEGFNSTIFAYGQTGSGKTYSMYGPSNDTSQARTAPKDIRLLGVIPRAISEIFQSIERGKSLPEADRGRVIDCSVYCSFVQIYNENLYDMLRDVSLVQPLTIREDSTTKDIYVQGLSEYHVKSVNDTLQLLRIAEENRFVRETQMNQFSSRSHSIFQIWVEQKRISESDGGEVMLKSKFNLVDLAGSEKWNINTHMKDEHITELTNINLSLHTLGRCISSLAQISNGRDSHVPYRESKLTRLLQDSLGGNSKTYLIATISPARTNLEESISTLKFADRAKQVMTSAVVNEQRPIDHAMVQRLQREVEYLRGLVKQLQDAQGGIRSESTSLTVGSTPFLTEDIESNNSIHGTSALIGLSPMNMSSSIKMGGLSTMGMLGRPQESYDLLGNLQNALTKERESSNKVLAENDSLKKELRRIKEQSSQDSANALSALQMKSIYDSINSFHEKLWGNVEKVQKIMKKFFKFEIEEDDMQSSMLSVFNSLQDLKKEPSPLDNFHNIISIALTSSSSSKLSPSKSEVIVSNTYANNSNNMLPSINNTLRSSKGPHHRSQASLDPGGENNMGPNSVSSTNSSQFMAREDKLQKQQEKYLQHLHNQLSQVEVSAAPSGPPSVSGGQPPKLSHSRFARQVMGQQQPSQGAQGVNQGFSQGPPSFGDYHSQIDLEDSMGVSSPRGSPKAFSPRPPPHNNNFISGGADNSLAAFLNNQGSQGQARPGLAMPSVAFRVRGASTKAGGTSESTNTNNNGGGANGVNANGNNMAAGGGVNASLAASGDGWISWNNEEDEEEKLRRELKQAKQKLKKQHQLQEWIRAKEERMMGAQKAEEEERKAMLEAEQLKEQKRKEHAKKVKKKVSEYHNRVKTEADQIKELMDLGIDPESLFQ